MFLLIVVVSSNCSNDNAASIYIVTGYGMLKLFLIGID